MKRRSFAILVSADRDDLQRARRLDEAVARRLRLERVGRRRDRQAGVGRELRAHARGELGVRVQAGADGGAAERDLAEPLERRLTRAVPSRTCAA